MTERFGGELPQGVDPLAAEAAASPSEVLTFSHGRAALGWFLDHHPEIRWVLHCAYTCPTVPKFFESRGCACRRFDIGAREDEILDAVTAEGSGGLVLLPALFGRDPWLDGAALARRCAVPVIIDAAQTAFGHEDYAVPHGGAVLSCPRKACALGSGAMLRLGHVVTETERASHAALPRHCAAARDKRRARELFRSSDADAEAKGVALIARSEDGWPDTPYGMDDGDLSLFLRIDADVHRERRRANATQLQQRLAGHGLEYPDARAGSNGVPFNLPLLLPPTVDRDRLLAQLRARRVFATPLWPDCQVDSKRHPLSATYRDRLLALPVDQRFAEADMNEIASRFIACLSN